MQTFQFVTLLVFLLSILVFVTSEISQTRLIMKQAKIRKDQRKVLYEDLLEKVADPYQIYQYFMEIKKRLPENLHNIMLAHCLNENHFAKSYINSLDATTGQPKDNFFTRKTQRK
jgi:hypothetical protein